MIQKQGNKLLIFILLTIIVFTLGMIWLFILRKAHSSFQNYYVFRGCVKLLEKNNDYGLCKIHSGKIIKIVKIQDKWYLEGDGPGVW